MSTPLKEMFLRQYANHTRTRENGDKVISLGHGLFDIFSEIGWTSHARFRIVRTRSPLVPGKQLIQISGTTLSREYRRQLTEECN